MSVEFLSRQGIGHMATNLSVKQWMIVLVGALAAYPLSGQSWVINENQTLPSPKEDSAQSPEANALPPKVYEGINLRMQQAWRQHVNHVRNQWPDAQVSNNEQWVTYTSELGVRRVMDFRRNQVSITLAAVLVRGKGAVDYPATGKQVEEHLRDLIATTIAQALLEDPMYAGVWPELRQYAPVSFSDELVLSGLFSERHPSDQAISRLSRRLMSGAEIQFYHHAASASGGCTGWNARRAGLHG